MTLDEGGCAEHKVLGTAHWASKRDLKIQLSETLQRDSS